MIPKRIFWERPGVIFGLTRPPCRPQSGMPIVVEEKEMASPLNVRYGINVGITFKRLALEKLWTPVKVKSAPVATSLAADPKS